MSSLDPDGALGSRTLPHIRTPGRGQRSRQSAQATRPVSRRARMPSALARRDVARRERLKYGRMPHVHHGIPCRLPPHLPWCESVEQVLAQIARVDPTQHGLLLARLIEFCPLPSEIELEVIRKVKAGFREIYAPNATFMLPAGVGSAVPDRGSIELTCFPPRVPQDPARRACIVAQELAHACDVLGSIVRTGAIPGRSARGDEEEADRLVIAWGFNCAARDEMRPGGWYDREDSKAH